MRGSKSLTCREFQAEVVHFQADELPEARRQPLQEHLDGCPACARYLAVEDSFLRLIRASAGRVPAPPGLETRIRARLAGGSASRPRRGLPGWLAAPGAAAAAAALILGLSLVLVVGGMPGGPGGGRAGVIHVVRTVTVVDRDCDRAGRTLEQQRGCRHPEHVNALKPADGMYWNLSLGQDAARALALDPARRGERITVEGDFYPDLSTIRLTRAGEGGQVIL